MLPLSLVDSVNDLRFTSLLGVVSIFYLVVSACTHCLSSLNARGWSEASNGLSLVGPSPAGGLLALPVMIFAYTCQTNVFSVYGALQRPSPRRMRKVSRQAIGICFFSYLLMGVSGFLDFGSATR